MAVDSTLRCDLGHHDGGDSRRFRVLVERPHQPTLTLTCCPGCASALRERSAEQLRQSIDKEQPGPGQSLRDSARVLDLQIWTLEHRPGQGEVAEASAGAAAEIARLRSEAEQFVRIAHRLEWEGLRIRVSQYTQDLQETLGRLLTEGKLVVHEPVEIPLREHEIGRDVDLGSLASDA
jgi:hypothetical protein